MTKITAAPAILNGKTRWHFATIRADGSLNRSLKTWASKRDALAAGKRECRA
jgi:hypothetical protein